MSEAFEITVVALRLTLAISRLPLLLRWWRVSGLPSPMQHLHPRRLRPQPKPPPTLLDSDVAMPTTKLHEGRKSFQPRTPARDLPLYLSQERPKEFQISEPRRALGAPGPADQTTEDESPARVKGPKVAFLWSFLAGVAAGAVALVAVGRPKA